MTPRRSRGSDPQMPLLQVRMTDNAFRTALVDLAQWEGHTQHSEMWKVGGAAVDPVIERSDEGEPCWTTRRRSSTTRATSSQVKRRSSPHDAHAVSEDQLAQGRDYDGIDSRCGPISRKLRIVWRLQWHLQPDHEASVKTVAHELKTYSLFQESSSAGVQTTTALETIRSGDCGEATDPLASRFVRTHEVGCWRW